MSYPLVESLPYTSQDYNFQQGPHPMAEQVVTVDKLYGYGALTHGHQKSNNSEMKCRVTLLHSRRRTT